MVVGLIIAVLFGGVLISLARSRPGMEQDAVDHRAWMKEQNRRWRDYDRTQRQNDRP